MDNIKNFEDFLDRMQGLLDSAKKQGHIIVRVEDLENTFPELKESEDERIMKAIHIYLDWLDGRKDYAPRGEYTIRDMIAWLEKQGESTDINPSEFDLRLNKLLKQFETLPKEELASSLSFYLNVVQNDGTYKADEKQDKQNPCETCEEPRLNCQNFPCERKKNFKPAEWSEKDERKLQLLIVMCDDTKGDSVEYSTMYREMEELKTWLKSLKDRIQPKQEWGQEDKDNIQRALYYVDYYRTHKADTKEAKECFDWLMHLKPQTHWKPTEAQLASLRIACDRNDRVGFDLTQLLKELKEL